MALNKMMTPQIIPRSPYMAPTPNAKKDTTAPIAAIMKPPNMMNSPAMIDNT